MPKQLSQKSLRNACKSLARDHSEFARVYEMYGVPPMWDREPGFATLLHIILEQQVSLASAKASFDKLVGHIGHPTPAAILDLDDATLKLIGFSRQKTSYARHLSESLLSGRIDLSKLDRLDDAEVKSVLTTLKGVGEWTSDIYLLMAMLRPDVMPRGDIALHEAYRRLADLDHRPSSDEFIALAAKWSPYRSTAARLLWHYYLSEKRTRMSKK